LLGVWNIGEKYIDTRHNVGFEITKRFVEKNAPCVERKFKRSTVYECKCAGKTIAVCHPNTYVNNSGLAAKELFEHYGIAEDKMLVVIDDFNLNLATVRFRKSGSDGGHNGLKSIIANSSKDFARLRFGIGPLPEEQTVVEFVLGKFDEKEKEFVSQKLDFAVEAIECYFEHGIVATMNNYNAK